MTLPYQFRDPNFLERALTHPSFIKSNKLPDHDNERLEFFGDSILSMVIVEFLYNERLTASEGNLSIMHSNLVNSNSLARVAASIGLGAMLILDEGEESSGGRDHIKNLENAMEALIAAIYLDSDYDTVRQFIIELWHPFLYDKSIMEKDKKSLLQEWAQHHDYDLPVYILEKSEGSSHSPTFTMSVTVNDTKALGEGRSKKEAEQKAAATLLEIIDK